MEMVGGNEEGNEQVDEVEILVECESRSSDKTKPHSSTNQPVTLILVL